MLGLMLKLYTHEINDSLTKKRTESMCVSDRPSKQANWKHTCLESEIMLSSVTGLERVTGLC